MINKKSATSVIWKYSRSFPDVDFHFDDPFIYIYIDGRTHEFQVKNLDGITEAIEFALDKAYDGEVERG